jgi:hypothetical protein
MKSRRLKCVGNVAKIGDKNACQNFVVEDLKRGTLEDREYDRNTKMDFYVLIMERTYDRIQ